MAKTRLYAGKSSGEIFKQRNINNAMSPHGVTIRESRDSDEHPNSVAIVIALDVTGSMGSVPKFLVQHGFPEMMKGIIESGIPDPQILFMAIGDHECDRAPLQVGQFESSDELLDHWLTSVWLEGGGGGNDGESYHLAWYFGAYHTDIDCFNKRNQKGVLITIGDEPVLKYLPITSLKNIMGSGQYPNSSAVSLLDDARKKYHVAHIHISETSSGSRKEVMNGWKEILGYSLYVAKYHTEVADLIKQIVIKHISKQPEEMEQQAAQTNKQEQEQEQKKEEMML